MELCCLSCATPTISVSCTLLRMMCRVEFLFSFLAISNVMTNS